MTSEDFPDIYYLDHPHFHVGRADQWGESGYLYYEGMVYSYEEDRKGQWGRTYSPQTIAEFLEMADRNEIKVPESFRGLLDDPLRRAF